MSELGSIRRSEEDRVSRRNAWAALAVAVILAAVLQWISIARSPTIAPDGITFIELARELQRFPAQSMTRADQHPGYPFLILGCHRLLIHRICGASVDCWISSARLAAGIFGILCVVVIWGWTKLVFSSRVAALAALLAAVFPVLRQNAADALSDSPHLFFYLLAVYCCTRGFIENRAGWFAAAGASSGLAFWIRPEGLSVAIVAALCLTIMTSISRASRVKSASAAYRGSPSFSSAAMLLLAALLVVSPYVMTTGKLTSKKDPLKLFSVETWSGRDNPSALVAEVPYTLGDRVMRGLRYFLVVPLVLAIVVRRKLAYGIRAAVVMVSALAAFHLLLMGATYILAGYAATRHMMPVIGLALPWIASGLLSLKDGLDESRLGRRLALGRVPLFSTLGVLLIMIGLAWRSVRPMNRDKAALVDAASQIAQQARAGDLVVSNSPYISFHSGVPGRVLIDSESFPQTTSPSYRFVVLDSARNFNPVWPAQVRLSHRLLQSNGREVTSTGILIFENR